MKAERLRVGKYRLHYTVEGQGFPLVLVHGLAGSGRWWAKNIDELAADFQVYTVDLAGFGGSRGQRFVLQEAPALLVDWLDAVRIPRCHIIGHSMGGYVTASLAARYPQRFVRIVLVDPVVLSLPHSLLINSIRLVRTLRFSSPDFMPVLASDVLRAGPLSMYRAIHTLIYGDMRANLLRIQNDLLVVWGEKDALVPLELGRQIQQLLPAAKFVVIPGAGHIPMWERSREFNQVVMEFLRGV